MITIDYSEIASKDPYFYLRMSLRPDLHEKMYPEIPNQCFFEGKIIPEKKTENELVITNKGKSMYGEDPYKEIRKIMDPVLHRKYYPDEV